MMPETLKIFLFFMMVFVIPILGALSILFFIFYTLDFLYRKYRLKQESIYFTSKKIKYLLIASIVLNSWNSYLIYMMWETSQESIAKTNNQEMRSRFYLTQDYQHDQFVFPKGTLVNIYNVYDDGRLDRHYTLYGLEKAKFPQPAKIAGAWASRLKMVAYYEIWLQLAHDQQLGPVYMRNAHGKYVVDPSRQTIACKQNQLAEYVVSDDYHAGSDFSDENWFMSEDETFDPTRWLFRGCTDSPSIFVEPAYPQKRKYNNDHSEYIPTFDHRRDHQIMVQFD